MRPRIMCIAGGAPVVLSRRPPCGMIGAEPGARLNRPKIGASMDESSRGGPRRLGSSVDLWPPSGYSGKRSSTATTELRNSRGKYVWLSRLDSQIICGHGSRTRGYRRSTTMVPASPSLIFGSRRIPFLSSAAATYAATAARPSSSFFLSSATFSSSPIISALRTSAASSLSSASGGFGGRSPTDGAGAASIILARSGFASR
mmetsp:Transcript_57/g.176  ORF Transcript_57/g.176 Transcript_57/m.176 type:complete len:202 (+) Transcript_57:177-782(+)